MKSYLELVRLSAKARRGQNRMTVLCIVLSVFLVTSVLSVMDTYYSMETERLIHKHGSFQYPDWAYPTAAVVFLLILIAGVLMISGCLNSSVAQRTRFFGMLRCVGASRRQIIRLVRLEALAWCRQAVPLGCLLGIAADWLLCFVLRCLVKGEFAEIPLFYLSAVGVVCGAVLGVVTVLLAAHAPARRAAAVSPIAAVSDVFTTGGGSVHGAGTRRLKTETALGVRHAAAPKKNLFLMAGSFAFVIVLFFVFSAALEFGRRLLPSMNPLACDIQISSADESNSLDRDMVREIAALPGVSQVFGSSVALGLPVQIGGESRRIDLVSYDGSMMEASKEAVAAGELSQIYGDSGRILTVYDRNRMLNRVGDTLQIGGEELTVACVVSAGPGIMAGDVVAGCSEETFARITGERDYCCLSVRLTRGAPEETVEAIRRLSGSGRFEDRRAAARMEQGTYWVTRIGAYGFLVIIALIAVLHIMNSVSMSVSARIPQYGVMRAVGMSGRQLKRMIAAETAVYAAAGGVPGCAFGLLMHYCLIRRMVLCYFGGSWRMPVGVLLTVFLLLSGACALAVYAPSKRITDMEITETISHL